MEKARQNKSLETWEKQFEKYLKNRELKRFYSTLFGGLFPTLLRMA